jgi:hypothetical protein
VYVRELSVCDAPQGVSQEGQRSAGRIQEQEGRDHKLGSFDKCTVPPNSSKRLTSTSGACKVQKNDAITYRSLRWWAFVPEIAAIVLGPVPVIGTVTAMVWACIGHAWLLSILPGHMTLSSCWGIDLERGMRG